MEKTGDQEEKVMCGEVFQTMEEDYNAGLSLQELPEALCRLSRDM